ncbi:hypothetical protein [Novosphingobium sp. KA1]|uniref:hypothetical protein n=1 Tax=Novosphingobium sp. (strain KA1) TaxID=164608 RepID=UPI001A9090E7|nr:hypothetical protein [Novosphingobium sp. KA1]QSR19395.1 hypothetical protein CA833_19665 [Novosphingobium sp. KA1]
MSPDNERIKVQKEDARAGTTPGVVRYVLLISLILVVAALSMVWIVRAVQAPKDTGRISDTRQAVEQGYAAPQDQPGMQSPAPPAQ